jgi:membrane protease YdiL (CAAX protease family)
MINLVVGAAATTPTSAPATGATSLPQADPAAAEWFVLAVFFLTPVALFLVVKLRVLRPRSVVGPDRRPPQGRLWTIAVAAAIGYCAWQFISGMYLATLISKWKAAGIEYKSQRVMELLTPKDSAFLSTVPPTIAFFMMLACNAMFAPGNLAAIGINVRKLLRGVGSGVVAFLIVGPMMFWVLMALDQVYRAVHYQHPSEHALLKSLGEAREERYAAMLALGAVMVAPLLEELLFRGHLQTFIRQWLIEQSWRRELRGSGEFGLAQGLIPQPPPLPPPLPLLADGVPPVLPYMSPLMPPLPPLPPPPPPSRVARPWHGWVAILITSVCFAALHETWTAPAIFILSLSVGYVYERTGNLWSSITVHLLFNTLNTLQFIFLMHHGGH